MIELPQYIRIKNYLIDFIDRKQLLYILIYGLRSIKLKTLKTYIKTNLTNSFIHLLKFLVDISILFIKKLNNSFYLCSNYYNLNNLTIKNHYLLPFISEYVDQLGQVKYFT